jgi:CelD/BcsL family acetyltransferase involved in cellulose biosynthesis
MKRITIRIADGFDDPSLSKKIWNDLLEKGSSDVVFLTKEWQQIWWDVYGRGTLLLTLAESDEGVIAIAPLFADSGMIFFIGSGCSDYLDFIGDISNPVTLEGMLKCAKRKVPDFCGFRFYHILEDSKTGNFLKKLHENNAWKLCDEGSIGAPMLEMAIYPELADQAVQKKSLRRHEAYFQRNSEVELVHFRKRDEILKELEVFFSQHINRWAKTPYPSLFNDQKNKEFYKELAKKIDSIEWLRFTGVKWQDQIIAYHFGFVYKKTFLWYKPTFDMNLAKHSPGEVLLRQLLLQSIKEEDMYFDFGLGEEPFKSRFATKTRIVKTGGLYTN